MLRTPAAAQPRDRRQDARRLGRGNDHRPILGRFTVNLIAIAAILIVVYGTVGPLGTQGGTWLAANPDAQLLLTPEDTSPEDVYTNILVYIPVGVGLRLLLRRRGSAGLQDAVLALALAGTLSYVTEYAQQFMPARSSNLYDVIVNLSGAAIGSLAAPFVQHLVRRRHRKLYATWHATPWVVLGWWSFLITLGLMTQPFIPTQPSIDWSLSPTIDANDIRRMGMFAITGLLVAIGAAREQQDLRRGIRAAMTRVGLLAIGAELLQIVLLGHTCSPREMIIAVAGGTLGLLGAIRLIKSGAVALHPVLRDRRRDPEAYPDALPPELHAWRPAAGLIAAGIASYLILGALLFAPAQMVEMRSGSFAMLPFQPHFNASFYVVLAESIEAIGLFAVMTVTARFLNPRLGRVLSLTLIASSLTLMWLIQALVYGGPLDPTCGIFALFGWVGGTLLWRALLPALIEPKPAGGRGAADGLEGSVGPALARIE